MSRPGSADATGSSEGAGCENILARINEREREIERILSEAHSDAEAAIVEAERTAAGMIAARRAEADLLTAQAGEEIVALARREAEAIRAAARIDAARLLATPRERIERAAERMLAIVLPGPSGDKEAL